MNAEQVKQQCKQREKHLIAIKTFGCTFNQADSLYMQKLLEKNGFKTVHISFVGEHGRKAVQELQSVNPDVVILNSCTVKTISENKLFRALNQIQSFNKAFNKQVKVIITGCVPQANPEYVDVYFKNYSVIGTKALDNIVKAVQAELQDKHFVDLKLSKPERLKFCLLKNKVIDIIPISEGCTGACYFCKTKQARFNVHSNPVKQILQHINLVLKNYNVKEFWITSQDLGAYGLDINTSLPQLLNEIKNFKQMFLVRLGMINPQHLLAYGKQIANALKDLHFFKFLHVPVQSGSEHVVKTMNRPHTVKEFLQALKLVKQYLQNFTLATDIIVGYPTETEQDFEESLKLLKHVKPDIVNVSKYWPRPKTIASKLKPLPTEIVKQRSKIASQLSLEIGFENNKKFLNKELVVLIDEVSGFKTLKARALNYKQVVLEDCFDKKMLGLFARVKITSVTSIDLRGYVLETLNINTAQEFERFFKI